MRSALLVLCSAFGVAGVIVSVDFAAGGRAQVLGQIQRMGTNLVMVTARADRSRAGRARTGSIVTTLRPSDYDAIRRDVNDIARSSAVATAVLRLKAGDFSKIATVVGCEPEYFAIKAWPLVGGAIFSDSDLRRTARVALVGHRVSLDLYGVESPVGQRLFINRVPFVVVGVMSERGQGLDVSNEDEQVYVPLTTAMRRLANVDFFNALALEIHSWTEMDRAAGAVGNVLSVTHRVSRGRPPDFEVQNQKELVDTQAASSARLEFFVGWVGWSGLLASGLGILAIMWITVRNRTTEIGTRRACGATADDIFLQFASEAALLATIGSAVGAVFGWSGTQIAAARAHVPSVFDRPAAIVALSAAFVVNVSFAAWPAYLAARLDPVVALKKE